MIIILEFDVNLLKRIQSGPKSARSRFYVINKWYIRTNTVLTDPSSNITDFTSVNHLIFSIPLFLGMSVILWH